MKKTNQFNEITSRVAKGMIAIFSIKLLLFSGIFIFQSCTTENDASDVENQVRQDFLGSMNQISNTLNNLTFTTSAIQNKSLRTDGMISSNDFRLINNTPNENLNLSNFNEVAERVNSGDVILSNEQECFERNGEIVCLTVQIDEEEVLSSIEPAIQEAKNVLYTKGYTDQDINEMLSEEGAQEEDLVPVVMSLLALDEQENNLASNNLVSYNFFFNSAHAYQGGIDWGEVGNCAAAALGINAITSFASLQGSGSDRWKRKAITKLIGKVASRFLGPVGVAITIGSFALCMAGWD